MNWWFKFYDSIKGLTPWKRKLLVIVIFVGLVTAMVILGAQKRNEAVSAMVDHLAVQTIPALPDLKVGDVILRKGVGADSYIINEISHSNYSHVGVVSQINPRVEITHATTADDAGSPFEGVITVPIANFVSEARALAIVRYEQIKESAYPQISEYLHSQEGKVFDLSNDPDATYCSNLVYFALKPHTKTDLKYTFYEMLTFSGNYIFPQAFLDDPNSTTIYEYLPDLKK